MSNGKMPDYIIIGTQKCGTTSLYSYLVKHPQIARANKKELYFFNNFYNYGVQWYKKQFPSIINNENLITGEATPNYVDDKRVPRRVFKEMPNARLIMLIRNPVDRAYSQYHMGKRNGKFKVGNRTKTFEEMINDLLKGKAKGPRFLSRGIYVDHIKEWLKYFPKEQLLIINSEEFYSNTPIIYKQVLDHLNVRQIDLPEYKNVSKRKKKYSYPEMSPKTRKMLVEYFKPYNKQLYSLLGRNYRKFGWDQ